MPVRSQPIDSDAAAFEEIFKRLRRIDDSLRSRLIPPGYHVNEVAGSLVIKRESDGAIEILDFT